MTEGKTWRVAIVMGGFGSMNRETGQMTYMEDRADRLWEAIRLYREGRVRQILITGDPRRSSKTTEARRLNFSCAIWNSSA